MDHAPYADQFILPRVEVPYLDKYEYDHGDFASFPQRTDLCNEDGILDSTRPISDIAAMVQAWLYFGLLEAYNGKPLDKKALISKTQPYLLDSTELPVILIDITRQMRKSSIQKYNKHLEALQAKLLIAVKAISEVDIADIDTLRRKYNSASAAIFLSIRVLLNTLCLRFHVTNWPCWNSVVKPRDLGTVLGHAQDPLRSFSAYLLMERMQQAGWCARQITQLLQTSDYCTGYYFSSIRRQEPGNISHGNCRTEYCIAYNTDPNAYIIRHVGRCRCSEFIEAPFNALERIIRDGDIPLIKIRKGRLDTSIKLEVVKLTPRSNYTAISHVWIDGLGNPKANSLPRCQLEKLYKHLIALETSRSFLSKASSAVGAMSDPLFWMDTLCIPVKPHDELKKMQIDRMALIYASARQVLVLDEELSNVNCTTEPSELLNARIVSSKWNTRCWTLQEGALARICFYQFQDAAFCTSSFPRSRLTVFCKNAIRGMRSPLWSLKCFWYVLRNIRQFSSRSWWSNTFLGIYTSTFLSDLTAQLHQGLCTAAHESIQSDLVMADEHKFRYYNPQLHALLESQPKRFARTWSNVGKRSTTMAEDIHVVIANLTGFRVSQIMDELSSPVERTKIMLYCVGEFPLDILFNDCPRAEEAKGNTNRWVPSCPGSEPLITNVKLRWGPTGLVILDSHNSPNLFLVEGGAVNHRFCFK
ncbi:hypothetical protein AOQ84DRAFT_140258 [Glonium stellatum]|uniref:Heterokaryon incompatibility domain-containing protein n=1 Tax=Glonium stellatum TaxID=574774 RepID=A0A8E2JX43_9PEZI|nr:hypothetical protein AOQ84DRAFT_140258 [Glonium stellatum]